MDINVEFWASFANAAIYLCLIAIPWVVGPFRPLVLFLGFGGFVCLLGFDFVVGAYQDDYGLAADLVMLSLMRGIFFFVASWAVEKVFRSFMGRIRENKPEPTWHEEEIARKFDRNLRGLKDIDSQRGKH